jgi:putative ABC transport system permease protein
MLKNYLKIAARNLAKHKFYSFINIIGLAIGLTCTLLILLYVQNELSYDKYHSKADRIFRVQSEIQFGEKYFNMTTAPAPLAAALIEEFPDVEASVRLRKYGRSLVKTGEITYREEGIAYADSSIFSVFDIELVNGADDALYQPNSIIIDETTAQKYFGNENPIGERLLVNNETDLEITGVFKDMPDNGHFQFRLFISMATSEHSKHTMWLSNNYWTYALLKQGSTSKGLEAKLPAMIIKYVGPQIAQILDISMDDFKASGNFIQYSLVPLTDIHLHSNLDYEIEANGDILYVYLFAGIAFLILALAAINFMNLSTARSASRSKEVGVRKVLGSLRSHLIKQFLSESMLISALSMVAAVFLAWVMLPAFNKLADIRLVIPFSSPVFYLAIIVGILAIGFIAGAYPAFYLSAFKPAAVLKGNLSLGVKSGWLRSSLVVFQFVISTVLIIGTIVIYKQLQYIQTKNLGFNKDRVILVEDAYALGDQSASYKSTIKQIAGIDNASYSGFLPVSSNRSDGMFWLQGQTPNEETMVSLQSWIVDYDYMATLDMQLLEGRNFDEQNAADSMAIIINEETALRMSLKDPIGAHIVTYAEMPGAEGDTPLDIYTVIGIVKNFHYESMKENISPLSLGLGRSRSYLSIRASGEELKPIIQQLETEWNKLADGQPFSYSFLDEKFGETYKSETRVGNLFSVFAILAIFIACLGLFGLAAFTAQQRTKEIGVRKVMGASVPGIVMLLSREFGKLVVIALVIAIPLAWYGISQWLQDYKFRIDLGPWVFVLAGGITFLIAWLTMSYQSIKAAKMSPAKSLRDE